MQDRFFLWKLIKPSGGPGIDAEGDPHVTPALSDIDVVEAQGTSNRNISHSGSLYITLSKIRASAV